MSDTSNGIIVDQAAADDARAAAARNDTPVTDEGDDGTLAVEALKIAAYTTDTPEATTARADIYLDWMKTHGR